MRLRQSYIYITKNQEDVHDILIQYAKRLVPLQKTWQKKAIV